MGEEWAFHLFCFDGATKLKMIKAKILEWDSAWLRQGLMLDNYIKNLKTELAKI
jgi:hypothetical protein